MLTLAKKDHVCDKCKGAILSGTRYEVIKIRHSYKVKKYHIECLDKLNEELLKENVKNLSEMSDSAKNMNKIYSDNEV